MTIQELIKEYRNQAQICFVVDYADKNSVKANNKAVARMYEIVDTLVSNFGVDGTKEFSSLLDITYNEVNIWAAAHLLEKMKVDSDLEGKALMILKNIAEEDSPRGLGFQHWLENWKKKTDPHASA